MKIHQSLVGAVLCAAVLGSGAVQAEPANDDAYCPASSGDAVQTEPKAYYGFCSARYDGTGQVEPKQFYGFCSTSYGDAADLKHIVSSVFTIQTDVYIYHVEVERYFQDYVDTEFGVLSEYPNCLLCQDTYQEAADKRQNEINVLKNKDRIVG